MAAKTFNSALREAAQGWPWFVAGGVFVEAALNRSLRHTILMAVVITPAYIAAKAGIIYWSASLSEKGERT